MFATVFGITSAPLEWKPESSSEEIPFLFGDDSDVY